VLEVGVKEPKEIAEGTLITRVRGGGDEDEVAILVVSKFAEQAVALGATLRSTWTVIGDASVGLVHDHQIRCRAQEFIPSAIGLDEIGGDDGDRVPVED